MSSSKKEREEWITFITKEKVDQITFNYDFVDDRVYIPEMDPQTLRTERIYKRESNKQKVLNSIQGISNYAYFDVNSALVKQYSFMISIDTNGRNIKGNKICVCTCYFVPGRLKNHKSGVPFHHLCSYIIKNPMANINPERLGWSLILSNKILYKQFKEQDKLSVIVDSEKDLLPKINSKTVPICGDYFLPNNVYLSYSSDKDKDTLPGQMIKMCHNVANSIFREIDKNPSVLDIPFIANPHCEGFVEIKLKNA